MVKTTTLHRFGPADALADDSSGKSSDSEGTSSDDIESSGTEDPSGEEAATIEDLKKDEDPISLEFDEASLSGLGTLEKTSVVRVTKRRMRSIERCPKAVHVAPKAELPQKGQLSVEISIGARGRVIASSTNSSDAPDANTCVNYALKRWRFPRPKGGNTTVNLAFSFTAVEN